MRRAVAIMVVVVAVAATLPAQGLVESTAPSSRAVDIFRRVERANADRDVRLRSYSSTRRYSVWEPGHSVDAAVVVSMQFAAPSTKTFKTVSETGVGWIQKRVFRRLIDAEAQAANGQERPGSALSLANYDAQLIGDDAYRDRDCYILELRPKRHDKYLLRGRVWIDKADLAIAKIDAEPEVNPSFWITRAPFVREYQRIDGFWLPSRDLTHSQIRLVGEYVLQIEYTDYHLTVQE